jgi:hemoglobin-like flavoprotein
MAKATRSQGQQINDQSFEELELTPALVQEVQRTWTTFMKVSESREAAGEAIYSALFEAAPSLQGLFRTPRAVMAMRFMNGLNQIVGSLDNPKNLKIIVETLGFQHLDLEVTIPRVVIFRDAIVDCLQVEMGTQFTDAAREGWCSTLNYVGGAYIFIRLRYTERLKILASSWATANNKKLENKNDTNYQEDQAGDADAHTSGEMEEEQPSMSKDNGDFGLENTEKQAKKRSRWSWKKAADSDGAANEMKETAADNKEETNGMALNTQVPTNYEDMFMFNAAVMGFAKSAWMKEVLMSFDTIVTHVSNSYRLQEECDVLSLRIAKYKGGNINFPEYKAVMLASLRSLVPKDWDSNHEVAWSWLWENVERMLKGILGRPAQQERALERLWMSMDDAQQALFRREVYAQFFALAPSGQDFFKQSTTRLHFIADRVVSMTLEIYKDPKKMVEDISALGLRHVGYGIPTELFGPFVTACVQVVRNLTDNEMAEEAFRWSLSLISRILTRVITEGSTIVMKAINTNSGKQLRKAVACAPRGKRALWMLNIQVGTQSISPFL